jgi:hypothetical protein
MLNSSLNEISMQNDGEFSAFLSYDFGTQKSERRTEQVFFSNCGGEKI